MFERDLDLLRDPATGSRLDLETTRRSEAGEVLEGELVAGERRYPIRNGIPRFVDDPSYNASWNYTWTEIDAGRGLNYRIVDRSDPAYEIHDLFDRNGHDGRAWRGATGKLAIELGCGVGQYSVRLAQEYAPERQVAVDLTGGVDVFRGILESRYPELLERILIVQANILELPFERESFDFVFSVGVLMHTGETMRALRAAGDLVKEDGQLNVWIYASEPIPYEAAEAGRPKPRSPFGFLPAQVRWSVVWAWIRLFRHLPHAWAVRIIRAFSSDLWYRLSTTRGLRRIATTIFPTVNHPDFDYRFINNYDGYCNDWSDSWSEHEVLPALMDAGFVPLGLADWRLGVWAVKAPGFFRDRVRD